MSSNFEVQSSFPAPRLFKAMMDWHNLAPKIIPHIVTGGTYLQGDGGVGSIRQINFSSAVPYGSTKDRIDFIDMDNYECKRTVFEGGSIGTKLESATTHIKIEPNGSGSICKFALDYKLLPGAEYKSELAKGGESCAEMLKLIESYFAANPTAYA